MKLFKNWLKLIYFCSWNILPNSPGKFINFLNVLVELIDAIDWDAIVDSLLLLSSQNKLLIVFINFLSSFSLIYPSSSISVISNNNFIFCWKSHLIKHAKAQQISYMSISSFGLILFKK